MTDQKITKSIKDLPIELKVKSLAPVTSLTKSIKDLPIELKVKTLGYVDPEMAFKILSCNLKLFTNHIGCLVKPLKPYEILKYASKSKLDQNQLSNVLLYIFEKFKLQKLSLTLCDGCTIFTTKINKLCDWHNKYHKCYTGYISEKDDHTIPEFNTYVELPVYEDENGSIECIDQFKNSSRRNYFRDPYDSDSEDESSIYAKKYFDSFVCDLCGAPDSKEKSHFCPGCLGYRRYHIS